MSVVSTDFARARSFFFSLLNSRAKDALSLAGNSPVALDCKCKEMDLRSLRSRACAALAAVIEAASALISSVIIDLMDRGGASETNMASSSHGKLS